MIDMEIEQITLEKINEKIDNLTREFEKLKEDLEFAGRTEEAYKRHESGDFIEMDGDEFLKELKRW